MKRTQTFLLIIFLLIFMTACSNGNLTKNNKIPGSANNGKNILEGKMEVTFDGVFGDHFVDLVIEDEKVMLEATSEAMDDFEKLDKGDKVKIYYDYDKRSGDIQLIKEVVSNKLQSNQVTKFKDGLFWSLPDDYTWNGSALKSEGLDVHISQASPVSDYAIETEKARAAMLLGELDYQELEGYSRDATFIYYVQYDKYYEEIWVLEIDGVLYRIQSGMNVDDKEEKLGELERIIDTISGY